VGSLFQIIFEKIHSKSIPSFPPTKEVVCCRQQIDAFPLKLKPSRKYKDLFFPLKSLLAEMSLFPGEKMDPVGLFSCFISGTHLA